MPAPKKQGRGLKSGEGKGRQKSADGSSSEDDETKRQYNRRKKAEERGQKSTPVKLDERNSRRRGGDTSATVSVSSPSASRSRGRPPSAPSGPQTPNTRRRLNTEAQRTKRHTESVSRSRSRSVMKRWNKRGQKGHGGASPRLRHDDEEEEEVMDEIQELENSRRRLDLDEPVNADDEVGSADDEQDNGGEEPKSSRTSEKPHGKLSDPTWWRRLQELKDCFLNCTSGHFENLDVSLKLLRCYDVITESKMDIKVDEEVFKATYKQFSKTSERTIFRKVKAVKKLLQTFEEPEILLEDCLRATVLTEGCSHQLLEHVGVKVADHLLADFIRVANNYNAVKDNLLSQRRGPDRSICNRAAVQTATMSSLSIDHHGDIETLRRALGSTREYAKRILEAIKGGDVESLYTRARRKDSVKSSIWPQLLADFAKDPLNSRSCPGQERVTIAYRRSAPKYLLRRPRKIVIAAFLRNNPTCEFSASVLNREFPVNVISGTARDLARNCCPIHSNAGRNNVITNQ